MKSESVTSLFVLVTFIFIFGCSRTTSPTDLENKKDLITRAWKGENIFMIAVGDSFRKAGDLVLRFEFKNDGSYFLSQASFSHIGETERWQLEDNGSSIRLTQDTIRNEVFLIVELNSSRFILGDTTSRGYSLVPF